MPNEHKVDVALDDVFTWLSQGKGGVSGEPLFSKQDILDEVKECVSVYCEDNGIRTFEVDIEKTLESARVVMTLAFKEEEERYHEKS